MFRRLAQGISRFIHRKELVGADKNGNKYYKSLHKTKRSKEAPSNRWLEKEPTYTGRMIEKREVELIRPDEYDPRSLPPEWLAWLHKFRKEAPTAEECEQIAKEAARRAERVAVLELEEQKRKLKLESLKSQGMTADAQPNMQRYVEQLTERGYGKEEGSEDTAK